MGEGAFLAFLPFGFIVFWVAICTLLGLFAGWGALVQQFPDTGEPALVRMRMQSGRLGKGADWNPWGGVSYSNCLRFDICQSGLRVAVWRIFGPFERPFLVPWSRMMVEEKRLLRFRVYRFRFEAGLSELTIWARPFRRIMRSGLLQSGAVRTIDQA